MPKLLLNLSVVAYPTLVGYQHVTSGHSLNLWLHAVVCRAITNMLVPFYASHSACLDQMLTQLWSFLKMG